MDQKLYFKSIESMSIARGSVTNDKPQMSQDIPSKKSKRVTRKVSRDRDRSEMSIDKNRRREIKDAGIGSLKR